MTTEQFINSAKTADWGQVRANGGPPCFHFIDGSFCLRAKRWIGHGKSKHFKTYDHDFVSLDEAVRSVLAETCATSIEEAHASAVERCAEIAGYWLGIRTAERMRALQPDPNWLNNLLAAERERLLLVVNDYFALSATDFAAKYNGAITITAAIRSLGP